MRYCARTRGTRACSPRHEEQLKLHADRPPPPVCRIERAQGVKGEEHRFRRTVVEGALKQGNPEEVAWLLDEDGEEAVGGAARRPRWALFDAPKGGGHAAAAEELRERAPRGLRFCEPKVDFGPKIEGPLANWRAANPGAEVANVEDRRDLRDADFVHLVGLKAVNMWRCTRITDAGLAHLVGIHTLDMGGCTGITDAGLAHLAGIHTLNMHGCTGITDAGLVHLVGIHTLL